MDEVVMIFLLTLLLTTAQAQILKWQPHPGSIDEGYKIYWLMSENCSDTETRFPYSVDVGNQTFYDFSEDPNFHAGQTYLFRLATYNETGVESEQGETVCKTIDGPIAPSEVGAEKTKKQLTTTNKGEQRENINDTWLPLPGDSGESADSTTSAGTKRDAERKSSLVSASRQSSSNGRLQPVLRPRGRAGGPTNKRDRPRPPKSGFERPSNLRAKVESSRPTNARPRVLPRANGLQQRDNFDQQLSKAGVGAVEPSLCEACGKADGSSDSGRWKLIGLILAIIAGLLGLAKLFK